MVKDDDYDQGYYEGMKHAIYEIIMHLHTGEDIHDVITRLAHQRDRLKETLEES